jgi:SpoVK/Ycf46/Vps4 family AAA+-type ATPase
VGGAQRNWEATQANELLQQVEGFRGVLVIATNHSERMDPAFTRRFIFRVHLERPDASTRLELWKHWQSYLGLSAEEVELVSNRYELSGGEIRNIAVRTLARGESSLAVLESECQSELRNRTGRTSRALGI